MRKAFETCHWWHLGRGGNYKTGIGLGCNCPPNKIRLTSYMHDVLDGRKTNGDVERIKLMFRAEMGGLPRSYKHRWAFAKYYGLIEEFCKAMAHHEAREQGRTSCTKLKGVSR